METPRKRKEGQERARKIPDHNCSNKDDRLPTAGVAIGDFCQPQPQVPGRGGLNSVERDTTLVLPEAAERLFTCLGLARVPGEGVLRDTRAQMLELSWLP